MDITPAIITSAAIQDIVEALQTLTDQLPPPARPKFETCLQRVRQSKVELLGWCHEHR